MQYFSARHRRAGQGQQIQCGGITHPMQDRKPRAIPMKPMRLGILGEE